MKSNSNQCTVCHLISGDLWAGAEVMAFHLLKSLAHSDSVTVSAIVFNNGRLSEELKNAGIDVIVLEESKYSFPVLVFKVYQTLRTKRIDILHSHRQKENLLAFFVAILLRGVKLISTLHGMPETINNQRNLNAIITKVNFILLQYIFNRTVVVSNEIRNVLVFSKGFSSQKTIAIHNGIPLPSSGNIPKRYVTQSFTIGSAGRLVRVKDFGLLIDVANLLRNHGNIQFLLAGDGPLKSELQSKVLDLGLNNFTFIGHLDSMSSFYTQIDLFMNTSIHEGIPMTILEAMSMGIPVVAPHVGGIPEIINDCVEGFLIKGRAPQHYAEKCKILFMSQSNYLEMAKAAQSKIKNEFSVSKMSQKYINTYLEMFNFNLYQQEKACAEFVE